METEVRIVDRYLQECRNLFTMTNMRVKGNKEIDILAVDPKTSNVYHVEVCVLFRPLRLKETIHRSNTNRSRDGLDYFLSNKFDHSNVRNGISRILGPNVEPRRILVVGKVKKEEEERIKNIARSNNLEIMLIGECIIKLKAVKKGSRDDIVRTIELMSKYSAQ